MKVKYEKVRSRATPIEPLEEQVIYDWLFRDIAMVQGLKALGMSTKQPTSFYQRVSRVTKKWADEGILIIKKKDY